MEVPGEHTDSGFVMCGGTIIGNNAPDGGGVYCLGTCHISHMSDGLSFSVFGIISGNEATENGGGVYFAGNTFSREKSVKISENTVAASPNNAYLTAGGCISCFRGLEEGALIGVTTQHAPAQGNFVPITLTASADFAEYFVSDSSNYKVRFNTDHFELAVASLYPFEVTDDGNGTAGANIYEVETGETVNLTATPSVGYVFDKWEVTSNNVTIVSNSFEMPAAPVSVKAIFKSSPNIAITAAAEKATVEAGDNITISGTLMDGDVPMSSKDVCVDLGGIGIKSTTDAEGNYTLVFPSSSVAGTHIYEVSYTQNGDKYTKPVTITVKPQIVKHNIAIWNNDKAESLTAYDISGNAVTEAEESAEITLVAVSEAGYEFKGWRVVSPTGLVIADNKFTMPNDDVALEAVLEAVTPTPTPTPAPTPMPQRDYLDDLRDMFREAIESGSTATIYWDKGDAIPNDIMKMLFNTPKLSLDFKFTYKGVEHEVYIGPGQATNDDIGWYGALWLLEKYGEKKDISTSQRVYIVVKGDTLGKIAAKLNTTVDELLRLNPTIKNRNLIYTGDVINY